MLFNDSQALRQEYARIGATYEESEEDKHYKFILNQIESDPNKKETITAMTRIQVAPGEEYITYHHTWSGKNPIGSFCRVTQTNVGIYPKFEPIYERFIQEDNTFGQRLISRNTNIGYYIRFTKETAEELHTLCNDTSAKDKTRYYIMPEGGTKITVASYNDWLNGTFEDLQANGKITLLIHDKVKK